MINVKPSRSATPNEKSNANCDADNNSLSPHTIRGINALAPEQKRAIYTRLIPEQLFERFQLDESLVDSHGADLLHLNCPSSSTVTEMALYHQFGFQDPILYGQISDTLHGQVHVLLYILNDPASPRFDIDRMPDGTPTQFGTQCRNLKAELAAMQFGLSPGQVRSGLHIFGPAVLAFERFVASLGQEMYFAEPLYYHNAIIFERYGFSYAKGRKLMQRIQEGFSSGGDLVPRLDGSTPFRTPQAANSIRLRSWALHDNLLDEPFSGVTMYKRVGVSAGQDSCPGCKW